MIVHEFTKVFALKGSSFVSRGSYRPVHGYVAAKCVKDTRKREGREEQRGEEREKRREEKRRGEERRYDSIREERR